MSHHGQHDGGMLSAPVIDRRLVQIGFGPRLFDSLFHKIRCQSHLSSFQRRGCCGGIGKVGGDLGRVGPCNSRKHQGGWHRQSISAFNDKRRARAMGKQSFLSLGSSQEVLLTRRPRGTRIAGDPTPSQARFPGTLQHLSGWLRLVTKLDLIGFVGIRSSLGPRRPLLGQAEVVDQKAEVPGRSVFQKASSLVVLNLGPGSAALLLDARRLCPSSSSLLHRAPRFHLRHQIPRRQNLQSGAGRVLIPRGTIQRPLYLAGLISPMASTRVASSIRTNGATLGLPSQGSFDVPRPWWISRSQGGRPQLLLGRGRSMSQASD
jgi:hypothetical protein